jgi:hypothetical protein
VRSATQCAGTAALTGTDSHILQYRPPPALATTSMSSVQKYFAPLTAKSLAGGGHGGLSCSGSLLHMHHASNLEHQCSVLRISVDAGDIQGLPMNDQHMQQDAGSIMHMQRDASPSKWSQARSHSALAQVQSSAQLSINTCKVCPSNASCQCLSTPLLRQQLHLLHLAISDLLQLTSAS